MRIKNPLKGWRRVGLTWCSEGDVTAEVSRERNPDTGLIEWRAFAWVDKRAEPWVDAFTGQDLHEALQLVDEARQCHAGNCDHYTCTKGLALAEWEATRKAHGLES